MHRPIVRRLPARRGVIVVIVAVCLIALLGIVALVLEGGMMLDKRRQTQTAADAAAYGAALQLLSEGTGPESVTLAKASAMSLAAGNGFTNDGVKSTVRVNVPPVTGVNAGRSGYVEVVVEYLHTRSFSRVLGAAPITVQSRSVAAGTFMPTKASLLLLEGKSNGALKLDKGTLQTSGDIFVNSKGKDSVQIKKDSKVIADTLVLSGGIKRDSSRRVDGDVTPKAPPSLDPLAGLSTPPVGPNRKASDYLTVVNGQQIYSLLPGKYSELKFDHNDLVTMEPGIYTLDGEFRFKDQSSLTANDVLLVNLKKDMKFETSGSVQISPLTTGPYAGISIFQPADVKKKIKFRNDGDYNIQGTIYAPNGEVRFQKIDFTLGFSGDADDESDDDLEEFDDSADDGVESHAAIQAQIIARKLKLDKRTTVNIGGKGLDLSKPYLVILE